MKIYIIGPSGSGKTTFSKYLSKKYDIERFELDCLVYDDEHNHIRRSDDEIDKLFHNILKKGNWIIEDVGRTRFMDGMAAANKIYYLNIGKFEVYSRAIKRWFRHRLGKEAYNYPPTFAQLIDSIRTVKYSYKKEKTILDRLKKHQSKVIFLTKKELDKLIN